jgi:hypothetical protein
MTAKTPTPLRSLAMRLLIGVLLAGALTGCAGRRRLAAIATPAPQATPVISSSDPGAQLDQMLGAKQDQLSKTDTVPDAANP